MYYAAMTFESREGVRVDLMSKIQNALNPRIEFNNQIVKQILDDVPDHEKSYAAIDALSSLVCETRDTYFKAGILMGARFKGATVGELRKLADCWR